MCEFFFDVQHGGFPLLLADTPVTSQRQWGCCVGEGGQGLRMGFRGAHHDCHR
jgi:hypothetical protein